MAVTLYIIKGYLLERTDFMVNPFIAKIILSAPPFLMKPFSKFITRKYIDKYAKIKVVNGDMLRELEEPVIFASNHLSNSDGLVLNRVLEKFNPYFVAGIKLKESPVSRIGLEAVNTIPIHPNTPDIDAVKKCIKKINSGKSVLIFPEGTRSRTGQMIKGKKGVVLIAKKAEKPVIPIGITGTEKLMPINDSNMEKEGFHFAEVTVTFGKPLYIPKKEDMKPGEDYYEFCLEMVMKSISELLPEKYRGEYK